MNRSMNKRWGRKLLLFFIALFLFVSLLSFSLQYNNKTNAEAIIDDGPLGEKIVDIANGGYGSSYYAVTENGEVYAWGTINNESSPVKVLNDATQQSESYYLTNIKQVFGGGGAGSSSSSSSSSYAFALSNDGRLYGWGDNTNGILGLPENIKYTQPAEVPINFKVKDIAGDYRISAVLSERGEVYATGKGVNGILGQGTAKTTFTEFTKISQDSEGNTLPKIKDISVSADNLYMLAENGNLYVTGAHKYAGIGVKTNALYPTLSVFKDGTNVIANEIISTPPNGPLIISTDQGLYATGSSGSNKPYYVPINDYTIKDKDNNVIDGNFLSSGLCGGSGGGGMYIGNGKLQQLFQYGTTGLASENTLFDYNNSALSTDYNNMLKVVSGMVAQNSVLILSKAGGVYLDSRKMSFGNIIIKGTKAISNTIYNSKEKYNGDINIDLEAITGNANLLMFNETDLLTNKKTQDQNFTSSINITPINNERVYKKYEFYLSGLKNETMMTYIIDLYKKTPIIEGLKNYGKFKSEKTIEFDYNGFPENVVTATISKDSGDETTYTSGTKLTEIGNYTLNIKDQYGNTNTYSFTITNDPVAESVSFVPTDSNGLVYGNTITKAGNEIGTLSLVYADGDTPSTIKTISLGTDKDGSKFEMSGTTKLKVKDSDLNAGTYIVSVSGTDQNDMPFSGEITIVIGKATSAMAWNSDTQKLSTDGLALGKEVTLGVSNQPSGTTVTYGMKASNNCITLDSTTGKVKAIFVPTPASVTFTATPIGNDNYNLSSLELTVPIKKQGVSLNVELLDSDSAYKNDVSIKIGDPLPTPRITSTDPTLDVSTLGTPTYTYKKNNVEVSDPSIEEGVYTVSASYPSGSSAENYDITWNTATLRVNGITIDENNESDYFTLTSDGKAYTQGTWTNKDIIITPVHDTFNQMSVDEAENKTTNAYTYNVDGSKKVNLSFYNSEGAKVSATVNLKLDKTAPILSQFNYEDETSLRSMLRAVTFDHFFGKAQQVSFTGSDETDGSGLDHYRFEIVELDDAKNEKPASKKTGTLGLSDKLNLSINTSYRISAWAVDTAGNESDEKIERVFLSDEVAQLNITATSDGKPYDGSKWTKSGVTVKLSSTSTAGVEKYQYSSDGVIFHDITGDTITLPDPLANVDNVTYTFRSINNDHTECDKTLNLKIDTVKPEINITGKVNDSAYDGSLVDQNIELTVNQTNTNISGATYYYTTSPASKDSDPATDSNWKRYTDFIIHSANGTFTYYFKAISNAGICSEPEEYTVKLAKKEYTNITVNVTSEGKTYSPGNWAKVDVTFTLNGGLKDESQITGYEYTTTSGSVPSKGAIWKPVSNKTLKLTNNVKDQTYWFRVTPVNSDGKMSTGTKVNLDVDVPIIPTMTLDEINNTRVAQLINLFSFGNWMNKQAEVTMTSSDTTSGIDHYEYIETINGTDSKPKSSEGTVTYEDEIELTLKARACDKAGNCSAYTNAEAIKIDMKAPSIIGVKDQSEYKQYYLPRFVTITDPVSGLKQATYKKDNAPAGTFTDNEETEIKGEGSYEIYAVDEAGNEVTLTFKIVKLPNIETEIDGSDESREIIDQIIKELEEVKDKIDQNENDNYEQWIKDAEDKWDSLRKKVIEDDETTSKVEGQGDTTFDPNTELIVEEIPKENVPVLPRNAIKTYDVRLMKGDKEVLPNGDIKVYLPYDEKEAPIVYEITDDGSIKELTAQQENGYVTFVTNTLKKYAISNTAQKENKKDVCVVGPDNKADSSDDVCGSDGSTKNDDGSVTVPDGGKVIFQDKEIDAPDGAIINPDGSVDFPDGTHYDPDGNKTKDPDQKPDPKPDDNTDKVCVAGPDNKLGTDDDICGEGNGDKEPDKKPDGSIEIPDGGSVIFPDGNEVELPDGGIIKPDGSVELPDGTVINPDGTKKDPTDKPKPDDKKECSLEEKKEINIDTDGDNIPDINLDLNGDCKPELNIDVDDDNIPDIDIDSTGDGKADINIDTNKDGKPDLNIVLNLKWKPNVTYTVNGFTYNSMKNLIPDLNVDDDRDGSADRNVDTDKDQLPDVNVDDDWFSKRGLKDPNKKTVQGTYTNQSGNTGGASTSDDTKWNVWFVVLIITTITMIYTFVKKRML